MCEELARYIGDFLMFHMILNSIVHVNWVNVAQLHIVNTNAIISECLTVHVTDRAANLQKLLILSNGFFKLAQIIE